MAAMDSLCQIKDDEPLSVCRQGVEVSRCHILGGSGTCASVGLATVSVLRREGATIADYDALNSVIFTRNAVQQAIQLVVRSLAEPERYVAVDAVIHIDGAKTALFKQLDSLVGFLGPHPNAGSNQFFRGASAVREFDHCRRCAAGEKRPQVGESGMAALGRIVLKNSCGLAGKP